MIYKLAFVSLIGVPCVAKLVSVLLGDNPVIQFAGILIGYALVGRWVLAHNRRVKSLE